MKYLGEALWRLRWVLEAGGRPEGTGVLYDPEKIVHSRGDRRRTLLWRGAGETGRRAMGDELSRDKSSAQPLLLIVSCLHISIPLYLPPPRKNPNPGLSSP